MEEPTSFPSLTKEKIREQKLFIEWEIPEYNHHHKSANWFWTVGIVGAIVVVISLAINNILFALLAAIATTILIIYAKRPPEIITVSLTSKGIRMKDRLYPFANIRSFCIREHFGDEVLILDIPRALASLIVIPIDEEVVPREIVHQYLSPFIRYKEHDIPLTDLILEHLGF